MEMANREIQNKFDPRNSARSISPFLIVNTVGFDSLKILEKMEKDRNLRNEEKRKIAEELERDNEKVERTNKDSPNKAVRIMEAIYKLYSAKSEQE